MANFFRWHCYECLSDVYARIFDHVCMSHRCVANFLCDKSSTSTLLQTFVRRLCSNSRSHSNVSTVVWRIFHVANPLATFGLFGFCFELIIGQAFKNFFEYILFQNHFVVEQFFPYLNFAWWIKQKGLVL